VGIVKELVEIWPNEVCDMMSTSMGTPIDGVVGGGFRVTGEGGVKSNLAIDNGGGRAETVLSDAEGAECDTDWKASFARYAWSILCAAPYHTLGLVLAGCL